ncbi:helix-turn-helix domain-containing protein [Ramlibacter terrae]|uniref:Helix-turn-helix domain-containing protein n=1 Tax=Ramlibacter terrae TaxID=2732511 RepID=A0ABX6P3S9_9BURK|nr:helix-turn-helix domain-containing protein [Ramlibacter terrae]
MLKTVAEHAGMHPSKAHRYLVSFCRNGLAERDAGSGVTNSVRWPYARA